jgi:hypothetical protein
VRVVDLAGQCASAALLESLRFEPRQGRNLVVGELAYELFRPSCCLLDDVLQVLVLVCQLMPRWGVKFGRTRKLTPEQIERARELIDQGEAVIMSPTFSQWTA